MTKMSKKKPPIEWQLPEALLHTSVISLILLNIWRQQTEDQKPKPDTNPVLHSRDTRGYASIIYPPEGSDKKRFTL